MDLTDEDIWTLICAPPSTSSQDLASTSGLPLAQVMRVRLHYRREAWTCSVDYLPCTVCGELVTVGHAMGLTPVHAHCRPAPGAAIRAIQADRKRYLSKVPSHSSTADRRKYIAWTEEEDAELTVRVGSESMYSIGCTLDRSEDSVRRRRNKLRLDDFMD